MPRAIVVYRLKMIMVLPDINTDGGNAEYSKQEGEEYSHRTLLNELFPISILNGKVNAHLLDSVAQ